MTTSSGSLGSSPSIMIRGISSITAGTGPLYGSRGANGVIMGIEVLLMKHCYTLQVITKQLRKVAYIFSI